MRDSLDALAWLRKQRAQQILFKVCSTFDSTDQGNIGPVADALLDALGAPITLVCPAFPANGRTVYQGHLFVGRQLLSESPMRDHPLTPMRDANLVRVLGRQSRYRIGLVPQATVVCGAQAVRAALDALQADGVRHAIADAVCDADLRTLGAASADLPLLVGGSGIALGLPDNARERGLAAAEPRVTTALPAGAALVLAGSCSEATRAQVEHFARMRPARKLDPTALLVDQRELADAIQWMRSAIETGPALIYSSAAPDVVRAQQRARGDNGARIASVVEAAFGRLAQAAVDAGVRRLVVAGGETSGAVVQALGIDALAIGNEIDPGVPWTVVLGARPLALALKSGNFGSVDFFEKALAAADG